MNEHKKIGSTQSNARIKTDSMVMMVCIHSSSGSNFITLVLIQLNTLFYKRIIRGVQFCVLSIQHENVTSINQRRLFSVFQV